MAAWPAYPLPHGASQHMLTIRPGDLSTLVPLTSDGTGEASTATAAVIALFDTDVARGGMVG